MATLDRWRPYLTAPKVISFPRLELIGRDHEPPIVTGQGEVRILSLNRTEFSLVGRPGDLGRIGAELHHQRENPYDVISHWRLVGTDAEGVEWSLGWCTPRVEPKNDEPWIFRGSLEGLHPHDEGLSVSRSSNTECIYVIPASQPMAYVLNRLVRVDDRTGALASECTIDVLGSTISFMFDAKAGTLALTVSHSEELPAPYAENWIGEPLRILFGQLVFPRLVARNLGNGSTVVSIRPSPEPVSGADWAALWRAGDSRGDTAQFLDLYAQLLTFIAQARGKHGEPNFESGKMTALYEEIIQAAQGSRWVWALTLASSIEGLVGMLTPKGQRRTDVDAAEIEGLVAHIDEWPGSNALKDAARHAVHWTASVTAMDTLRELVKADVISAEQVAAWKKVRNAVMHGSLVSPYSNEDEDTKLLALVAMMHSLTRELIRKR